MSEVMCGVMSEVMSGVMSGVMFGVLPSMLVIFVPKTWRQLVEFFDLALDAMREVLYRCSTELAEVRGVHDAWPMIFLTIFLTFG